MKKMQEQINNNAGVGFDFIHRYTREEALSDGVLVDVTKYAKEGGFKIPVAMTRAVYNLVEDCSQAGQSIEGRMHDTFHMLHFAIRTGNSNASKIRFIVLYTTKENRTPEEYTLISTIGPGDEGEPVLTIMFPEED